jgi:hypothetical protein
MVKSSNKMTLQSSPKRYGKIIKTNEPINVSMSMFLRCSYYVYSQQELSTCLAGEKSICVNVSMSTFLSFFLYWAISSESIDDAGTGGLGCTRPRTVEQRRNGCVLSDHSASLRQILHSVCG